MFVAVRLVCPACGGSRIHHSRPRSVRERVRRVLTLRVPYRCHACGWRGWMRETGATSPDGPRPIHRDLTDAELERLEVGVETDEGDRK
ncbi:MAG TPA: hypothetical protein VHZ73_00725 [Vicinamibacterales bacterium]|jgi:predicted RNA-binding Zn-ribbon protein involved in translation (DUF1610 family)|nr:hypothetical protein [Vicinamibacterales bacterium]